MTLLVAGVMLLGCDTTKVTVSGTVSYQGQPIEQGEISFDPTDPRVSPDGAVITNGSYLAEVSPGEKIVRIRASRLIPAERLSKYDPPGLREDFLPAKFNANSETRIEIEATGDHTANYDLK